MYMNVAEAAPARSDIDAPDTAEAHQILEDNVITVITEIIGTETTYAPLVRRSMPPGTLGNLYSMYRSTLDCPGDISDTEILSDDDAMRSPATPSRCQDRAACRAQFYRRFKHVWSRVLKFRKSSTHAECTVCWQFKRDLQKTRKLSLKRDIVRRHHLHLKGTFGDRQVYWSLRAMSRMPNANVLCCITDAMDKSKIVVPRFGAKTPKSMAGADRPTLTLTAVKCHGHGIYMYLSRECQPMGSAYFAETLNRSLDQCWKRCKAEGRRFPEHLVVQVTLVDGWGGGPTAIMLSANRGETWSPGCSQHH